MGALTLRIRVLGALDLRYGETPLPAIESARVESLLVYLLLHRNVPQPRQHLAFLLWPDSTEQQARTNLRHVLYNLRRSLPECDRFLDIQPRTLQWRLDAPFWLDVAAFEEALDEADAAADGDLSRLREAVDLYAEDLLPTCYDEWLIDERERLRQRYLDALMRLATSLGGRGEYSRAIPYAERLIRADPLQEEAYRLLIQLHEACGDRARALRTYHAYAAMLKRELGVEPSALTREAYAALLPRQEEAAAAQPPGIRVEGPPLVGRAGEHLQLSNLWRATESGRCHFVLVTGEPGIGKTRLVEEFRARCVHRGALTAEARSYAAEGALAYAPVIAWLRSEPIRARINRLDRPYLAELARLLPELKRNVPGFTSPEALPESEQRQRLYDALARALLAPGRPLLLVTDDLQWCDQETLRFLHYLLRYDPGAPLLVAGTARREELDQHHPLHDLIAGLQVLERFTEIPLKRLTREETAVLARRFAQTPLAESVVELLHHETEGNPLFVVEALRAGWQPASPEHGRLSAKVQAVIDWRLAQLSAPARHLVGVAATIGRAFSSELLAKASEVDEDVLVSSLDELWRRHVFREQGSAAYDFSHDKIREAAYQGLSPALRRHHHLQVAQALESLHSADPGPVSAQLAAHYEHAGEAHRAVMWYERAADVGQSVHANSEAARLLERALQLLHQTPETAERQARELAILTALLVPLGAIEGYRSSRISEVQQRALALAREVRAEPEPPLLRSLALTSLSQGDFALAQSIGSSIRARGERENDDVLLVEGEYVLGIAAYWQGKFVAAREHFEASIRHYRPEHRRNHLLRYGQDPKVVCLGRLALTLWFLGCLDSAARTREAALALADEIGHPVTLSVALVFAAMLSLELGDLERLRECTARATTMAAASATQIQIPIDAFSAYLNIVDGYADRGIARIRRALDEARQAQSAPGIEALLVRLLLAACARAGAARAGLAAAEQALALPGGARLWQAEAHRLRGEFLAALGAEADEVEAEFERALRIARRQGAQMLILRAAVSRARYRMERGDDVEASNAYELLAAVVAAFPERRNTPDFREATAILARG